MRRTGAPGERSSPQRVSGLVVRVFAANLVVVAVAAVGALLAGTALAPIVLEGHMRMMGGMGAAEPTQGPMGAMMADLEATYRTALVQSLLWAIGFATVAAAVVAWFVTGRLVAPLRAMREASSAIAAGRHGRRLDASAPGEIGDLADAFNAMAEALEGGDRVRRQLVTDLAHELRTPISNLRGYLEALEDGVFELDDTTRGAVRRQVDRLERLVADLALLHDLEAGQLPVVLENVDLAALAAASVAAMQARFDEKGVALSVDAPSDPVEVVADPVRFGQVLENLLVNALRHTPSAGRVRVLVRPEGPVARLEVCDTGPGVPAAQREAVFRRFFRGDPARGVSGGEGTGVGLTIARALVERHGGTIGVREAEGGGAAFFVTLPAGRGAVTHAE
jgi:two-component system, OmpR family, sensor histidine kinase BaeS